MKTLRLGETAECCVVLSMFVTQPSTVLQDPRGNIDNQSSGLEDSSPAGPSSVTHPGILAKPLGLSKP